MKKLNYFASLMLLLLIASCGGGSKSNSTSGFTETYMASASAGELLSYNINTSNLTYSYTITKSSFGCEFTSAACHSGSGSLIKNADGSYSPSDSPSSKIHALQNGLLVGNILLTVGGNSVRVPIVGVSKPVTTTAAMAGTYNFMTLKCDLARINCSTNHGTATISADGSYTTCAGHDIITDAAGCPNGGVNNTQGNITSLGGGLWQFKSSSPLISSDNNYFLAFNAPNGQTVAVIDFNDPNVYGYGQGVMSTKAATTTSGNTGTYITSSNFGDSDLVSVLSNNTTSTGSVISQNTPWDGMATVSSNAQQPGYAMLAGNGVFTYHNSSIKVGNIEFFQVGLKMN